MPLMVADNYASELRRLNDRFCAATGIRRSDCVLDIGCGAGQTSRDAVRGGRSCHPPGAAVSEQLLERANGASTRSVRLLHVAQPQRSPATVCYLASNSKLMNPQLKIATRFRALPALSREARQVDDSMVRVRTIRLELRRA